MIIPKLVTYIQTSSTWHDEGRYDCIVDGIGLEMIALETEILGKFGMPAEVYYFTNILQQAVFSDLNLKENTEQLFERLLQEATSYLNSPTMLNTTLLAEAKLSNKIAQDVLPLMGIYCTVYTSFLYNEYYLSGNYTEKELLVELNFAQSYHIEKERIIPYSLSQMRDDNCYQRLLNDKLPHAKEFYEYLEYDTEIHLWDIEPNTSDDGIFLEEGMSLRTHEFYISAFKITNMHTCVMEILVPMPEGLRNVNLWCNVKMFRAILKFAKYYSQAVTLDLNVYYNGEYE